MIDARELRIGNIINPEYPVQVTVIDTFKKLITASNHNLESYTQAWCDVEYTYEECFGIPLSEEWLLRLGFKKYDECFFRINKSEGWFLNSTGELSKSISEFYIRIQFVHQLQNLYFCLTGEELTLK